MAPVSFLDITQSSADALGVRPGRVPLGLEQELKRQVLSPITFAGAFEVFDFSKGYDPARERRYRFGVGRWDEDRIGMYTTELFQSGGEPRTVHMGLDLQADEGTPVFAGLPGVIWGTAILRSPGDYGGVVIVRSHFLTGSGERQDIFVLYGHLSHLSVRRCEQGQEIAQGDLIGWLGGPTENGGWNPHLHLQMSWLEPKAVDLPGAVRLQHRELARILFPEPLFF